MPSMYTEGLQETQMYITQNARQAKSDQAVILLVLSMLVAVGVWLVSRFLSR